MDGKFWGKVGISTVIFGLGVAAINGFQKNPDILSLLRPPVQASPTATELLAKVTLVRSEMAVQETGHLARATFSINNQSNLDIKNIKIICSLLNDSGEEQGRTTWVLSDTIKQQTSSTFASTASMYVSARAAATQCKIVDAEEASAPLIAIHRATPGAHGSASGHDAAHADGHGDTHH